MKKILLISLAFACFSCANKHSKDFVTKTLTDQFTECDTVVAEKIALGHTCEEWTLTKDYLVCRSQYKDSVYVVFDRGNWQKNFSVGRIGHGHNEWVYPFVVSDKTDAPLVVDDATKRMFAIDNDKIEEQGKIKVTDPINIPKTIDYPLFGYVSLTPAKLTFFLADLLSGEKCDSIEYSIQNGNSQTQDFTWDSSHNKLVIAKRFENTFSIFNIENKHLTNQIILSDGHGFTDTRMFYSDVACGEHLYLLSQKHVNLVNENGHSEIEIYDFDGNKIKKIVLNFIADKLIVDDINKCLLMTSVADENLHIIKIGTVPI